MCECGCGELRPLVKFPAPDGGWYFLEVYPGCRYCTTTWAVGLSRCTAAEAGESFWRFFVEETPDAEFHRDVWAEPILDTRVLKRLFMEEAGESDDLAETPFALAEFIRQGGLIRTFHETRAPAEPPARGPEVSDDRP